MPTYRLVVDFEDSDCLNPEVKSPDISKILETYDQLGYAFESGNRDKQVPTLRLYAGRKELNMWQLRRYLDDSQQKRRKR